MLQPASTKGCAWSAGDGPKSLRRRAKNLRFIEAEVRRRYFLPLSLTLSQSKTLVIGKDVLLQRAWIKMLSLSRISSSLRKPGQQSTRRE